MMPQHALHAPYIPQTQPYMMTMVPPIPPQAQLTNAGDGGEIRTLWIGDLQYYMDEFFLLHCFAPTAPVTSVKLIRNKQTGQSEGYGFIEFMTRAAAESVLLTFNGTPMPYGDQLYRLNWATPGGGKKNDDSPYYAIFVGDLASDVTDSVLRDTFKAHYPSVKGARIVMDRVTGRSRGYGFVKFGDETEQKHAITEMNGVLCLTRPMRIGPATYNRSHHHAKTAEQISQEIQSETDPNNTTVFVGNLDSSVTDEDLRQVFSQCGQLVHANIPAGKRCGFVKFAERSSAEEALRKLDGTQMGELPIRLSWGRSALKKQAQFALNQGNGVYYGYALGYEAYGYAVFPYDPNFYYGGYDGNGDYLEPAQESQAGYS